MRFRLTICLCLLFAGELAAARRLPQSVVPAHYTLSFSPDIPSAKFDGHEEIQVHLLKPTAVITLNAADIEFHKIVVQSRKGRQRASVSLDPAQQRGE